jgi:hypothetical protein
MKSPPDWSVLPSEVLVSIFSQLPVSDLGRVAKVCKAWNRVSQCPQLWQEFEFVLSNAAKSVHILNHTTIDFNFCIYRTVSSR